MNITRSASCSIWPLSLRSESSGRLSGRCSGARFSCETASTGHVELTGEDLQAAADLADLLDAAVARPVRAHQLEVVDDDQAEAAACFLARVKPACLRAQLEDVDVG